MKIGKLHHKRKETSSSKHPFSGVNSLAGFVSGGVYIIPPEKWWKCLEWAFKTPRELGWWVYPLLLTIGTRWKFQIFDSHVDFRVGGQWVCTCDDDPKKKPKENQWLMPGKRWCFTRWSVKPKIFFFNFHPEMWGDDSMWRAYFFKWVGLKQATSSASWCLQLQGKFWWFNYWARNSIAFGQSAWQVSWRLVFWETVVVLEQDIRLDGGWKPPGYLG